MSAPKKFEELPAAIRQSLKESGDAMRRFYTMDTKRRQDTLDRIVDTGEAMDREENQP